MTVVDVVDTDLCSWAVLNANSVRINLCFAGSQAAWSRDEWLKRSRAIDVAAYLAVQDCKKYGFCTEVILPPYGSARAGISDHRYVTKCLKDGSHTDVGGPMGAPWSGFPWDVFVAAVNKYTNNTPVVTQPAPTTPVPASQWIKTASDRDLLEWMVNQMGPGDPAVAVERHDAARQGVVTRRRRIVRISGSGRLGLGDVSEETRLLKAFMRRKFSYAKALEDTQIYDPQMVTAVAEMQGRYNQDGKLASGTYTPGVINLETKYVMGYLQRPPGPDTRPVLFTVCGTGVPWWVGPDADTARAVEDKWRWQPIGYPAQPFPMSPSINAGKAELRAQLNRDEPGFQLRKQVERNGAGLAGYSQGAVIAAKRGSSTSNPTTGR